MNYTDCGRVWALSASVIVPLVALLVTGVNVSVTGQTAPGATDTQFPLAVTVGSDDAIEEISSGALPQLVTFSVLLPELFIRSRSSKFVLGSTSGVVGLQFPNAYANVENLARVFVDGKISCQAKGVKPLVGRRSSLHSSAPIRRA